MKYVDGFVITMPKKNLKAYEKMAKLGGKVWKKHGALDYKECIADDMSPEGVKLTFPSLTKAKPDEIVVFSYITFKSRAHRDKVNAKVMKDPLMDAGNYKDKPMPFEMDRMSYGGFKTIVDM